MTLVAAIVAEQLHLDLVNECLVQGLHGIAQNHIDRKEVVSCFNDIINLDCFVAGDDAVGFVQQLDLVASQPVAGHSTVTIFKPCAVYQLHILECFAGSHAILSVVTTEIRIVPSSYGMILA